jgi:hypothetical protein
MKKKISISLLLAILIINVRSQNLTQTVRGTILDSDSKVPLIGVVIKIIGISPQFTTSTNANGEFRFEKVPVGRIALQLTYLGYENKVISDIDVNSGKENVLTLTMQESLVKLKEVVLTANKREKGEAINEMSLISSRSISMEDTKLFAGGFSDPAKILSNFAGVNGTQTGQNVIIVRGNSPKYVQWRLEGVEITNPNHFADQNAIQGGVSALNNNLLATSDFATGAFSPEFGDVLSGVYDVKLRAGNNQKFESSIGVGIQGTDIMLEGPLKKGYGGSFLVNYRYSTISLLNNIGIIKLDGVLSYQDAAFKIVLPTKKLGNFSLFGLGGLSAASVSNVRADNISTPSNKTNTADITEDYDKENYLSNYGVNHSYNITKKSSLKTSISYSNNGIMEDIFKIKTTKLYDNQGRYLGDSIGDKILDYKNKIQKWTYRGAITYSNKINAKNTIQIGIKYAIFGNVLNTSKLKDSTLERIALVEMNNNISSIRNFISWKFRLNENITLVTGIHNMNVLYNNKNTIEPRLAISWKLNNSNTLSAGYGKHSTMESVHNYFAKVTLKDGSIAEPNKDLDLLKADHYVIGYEKRFGKNIRLKVEAYYQNLYNLPVENNDSSYYSTINEGTDFKYVSLVNKGTGKNYGFEITLERFFNQGYYYLANASIYNSKYKTLKNIERNTMYNGNYMLNILVGKEFTKKGKNKNRTLNLNGKLFVGGGQKYIPLLRDAQGNLAVNPATNQFWDYKKAYNNSIENIYQVTVSASYKWNKPKVTHELFINLDNLTNNKAKLTEFCDETKPNKVGNTTQFGLFPNIMYRVYF